MPPSKDEPGDESLSGEESESTDFQPPPTAIDVDVSASSGSFAAGVNYGNVSIRNALPPAEVRFPLVVGRPPALADGFQNRTAVLHRISQQLNTRRGVVLTGPGGVGKTQLAAFLYSIDSVSRGYEFRVWVDGTNLTTLASGLAAAGKMVRPDLLPMFSSELDFARVLLDWLAATARSWLLVIDNLVIDPREMRDWWPPETSVGTVVVTTQRRDPAFASNNRRPEEVGVFEISECTEYLDQRIGQTRSREGASLVLIDALGRLPLALAQATAVVKLAGWSVNDYLDRFHDESLRLAELFPERASADGYLKTVATTWHLAMQQARSYSGVDPNLTDRVAVVAACLASSGSIELLYYMDSIKGFLANADYTINGPLPANEEIRDAVRVLHLFSVLDHDTDVYKLAPQSSDSPEADLRTGRIRMHSLIQRAVRESWPSEVVIASLKSAADSLHFYWPVGGYASTLAKLIPSAEAIIRQLDRMDRPWLYDGDVHQLVIEYGQSLLTLGFDAEAADFGKKHSRQAQAVHGSTTNYFIQQDLTNVANIAATAQARLAIRNAAADDDSPSSGSARFNELADQLRKFLPESAVEVQRARFDATVWLFHEGARNRALRLQETLLQNIRHTVESSSVVYGRPGDGRGVDE